MSSPAPERKLAAVPAAPAPRAAGPPWGAGRRGWTALAALGVLLAIAVAALAAELARNARLEGRVAELSEELATTRSHLGAYAARLDEVRGAVARLHALVRVDPLAPPGGAPPEAAPEDPTPAAR
jgi:hypothetical protein